MAHKNYTAATHKSIKWTMGQKRRTPQTKRIRSKLPPNKRAAKEKEVPVEVPIVLDPSDVSPKQPEHSPVEDAVSGAHEGLTETESDESPVAVKATQEKEQEKEEEKRKAKKQEKWVSKLGMDALLLDAANPVKIGNFVTAIQSIGGLGIGHWKVPMLRVFCKVNRVSWSRKNKEEICEAILKHSEMNML